jgi:hypothetical protein
LPETIPREDLLYRPSEELIKQTVGVFIEKTTNTA